MDKCYAEAIIYPVEIINRNSLFCLHIALSFPFTLNRSRSVQYGPTGPHTEPLPKILKDGHPHQCCMRPITFSIHSG
jgi:hypothetical protein